MEISKILGLIKTTYQISHCNVSFIWWTWRPGHQNPRVQSNSPDSPNTRTLTFRAGLQAKRAKR